MDEDDLERLGYKEKDLQRWIVEDPEILGEEILVITTEFSKFEALRDRLDVMALDKSGKLVVVELKRDEADSTTDLQAIKYASYCATLTFEDIQKDYREFWDDELDEELTPEDVGDRFREFLDESFEEEIPTDEDGFAEFQLDNRPRIMLAAGSFGREITAPVMWLIEEYGMDITCAKIQAYEDGGGDLLLNTQQIIPIEEAEDYMTRRREKEEETRKTTRSRSTINVLLEEELVTPGMEVVFDPGKLPEEVAEEEWSKDEEFWRAEITEEGGLRWLEDGEEYSFSKLALKIRNDAHEGKEYKSVNGYLCWLHPEHEVTLRDLRDRGAPE